MDPYSRNSSGLNTSLIPSMGMMDPVYRQAVETRNEADRVRNTSMAPPQRDLSMIGSGSPSFNAALQEKYRILGQEADTNFARAQTERLGLPSEIAFRGAQAGLAEAQTREVAPNSASARNLSRAQQEQAMRSLDPTGPIGAVFSAMLAGKSFDEAAAMYRDQLGTGSIRRTSAPEPVVFEPVITNRAFGMP